MVGLTAHANGGFTNPGGQALYLNQKKMLNWGSGAGHTPLNFFDMGVMDKSTVFLCPENIGGASQICIYRLVSLFQNRDGTSILTIFCMRGK